MKLLGIRVTSHVDIGLEPLCRSAEQLRHRREVPITFLRVDVPEVHRQGGSNACTSRSCGYHRCMQVTANVWRKDIRQGLRPLWVGSMAKRWHSRANQLWRARYFRWCPCSDTKNASDNPS